MSPALIASEIHGWTKGGHYQIESARPLDHVYILSVVYHAPTCQLHTFSMGSGYNLAYSEDGVDINLSFIFTNMYIITLIKCIF